MEPKTKATKVYSEHEQVVLYHSMIHYHGT